MDLDLVSITNFFMIILIGLGMIYVFFKPLHIKKQKFVDVPQFEIKTFTMYELNRIGLQTLMYGKSAIKYSDRYNIFDINYTDNSKEYRANMIADRGIYKNNIVKLIGNVVYSRKDGLKFETQEVRYNKKSKIAISDTKYIMYMGKNWVRGSYLKYNNLLNSVESRNVVASYQIK